MTKARDVASNGGLTLITSGSYSAASSINISNCFSAAHRNYRIVLSYDGTANGQFRMRYKDGSGTILTANYSNNVIGAQGTATFSGVAYDDNQDYIRVFASDTGYRNKVFMTLEIVEPFIVTHTKGSAFITSKNTNGTTPAFFIGHNSHNADTSMTGVELYPGSGTITGTYRIYGYRD